MKDESDEDKDILVSVLMKFHLQLFFGTAESNSLV